MPAERELPIGGHRVRVWEQGHGPPAVFFAGVGGLPSWPPFLERLAETRRVIAPSLPGFPGAPEFRHLDGLLDWIVHAVETVEALDGELKAAAGAAGGTAAAGAAGGAAAAGAAGGCKKLDLIGSSVGGALAAEVAALAGHLINRLVLIAPFGLFDANEPSADIWAQPPGPDALPQLLCEKPERWKAAWTPPEEGDALEWQVLRSRAMEAAARFLFPLGDTGVRSRLHRVHHPTLLVRGERDRVLPASYNERFREALAGPARMAVVEGGGHLPELDEPDALAGIVNAFLAEQGF